MHGIADIAAGSPSSPSLYAIRASSWAGLVLSDFANTYEAATLVLPKFRRPVAPNAPRQNL